MRAGLEGRADEAHVFARSYETRTPPWVPLALLAIKIPLGIMALAFAGCVFLLPGKLPPAMRWPLIGFVAAGLFFLGFVCLKGVPYAGVRHLLFLIPVAALLAAVALERIFTGRSRALWAFAIVGVLAACVSALPQRRPWEYHNLLSGGSGNAWKHFNNEGVDLGQRSTELIAFFNSHKVDRDVHIGYWMPELLVKRAGIPRSSMDFDKPISADVSGWFYMRAPDLAPRNHNDLAALREATPEARFGNLLIYHGTFHLPGYVADAMYWRAQQLSYLNPPEPEKAERLLHRVMELDPHSYTAAIDLGNFALKRKEFAAAVSWYRAALENAPPQFRGNIAEQIAKLSTPQAAVAVSPLHNPSQE
jgi:tetratricopeptide (TPR) repeat protein